MRDCELLYGLTKSPGGVELAQMLPSGKGREPKLSRAQPQRETFLSCYCTLCSSIKDKRASQAVSQTSVRSPSTSDEARRARDPNLYPELIRTQPQPSRGPVRATARYAQENGVFVYFPASKLQKTTFCFLVPAGDLTLSLAGDALPQGRCHSWTLRTYCSSEHHRQLHRHSDYRAGTWCCIISGHVAHEQTSFSSDTFSSGWGRGGWARSADFFSSLL